VPQFSYVARNTQGKLTEGVLTSPDRSSAIRQVEREFGIPIKLQPIAEGGTSLPTTAAPKKTAAASGTGTPETTLTSKAKLGTTHIHLFTEQLAHLLVAGMTLDEALGILVKRLKHPKLGALSKALHQALVDGRSLSQALRDFPAIFSPLYVNMVSAGEASGTLPDILHRLVKHLGEVKAMRDRVQQALIYPALLVVVGLGLVLVFIKVMVPQLMDFLSKTGQALPVPAQILLKTNELLTDYWWVGIFAIGGSISGFKLFIRSPQGRAAWDTFRWKAPVLSLIPRYRFYAQFARTLGTLIENGVTLLRALELLEEVAGNEYVRTRMTSVRQAVMDGASVSVAMTEQAIFPELFADMMAVGEQSGKFGNTMLMIADVYERELDKQVQITASLIPPLVMLVIASVVGLVVYAILSAVFSISSGLHG